MKSPALNTLIILLLLIFAAPVIAEAPIKVVFLSPDPPGNAFWDSVIDFMKAVAEDLNIDLQVHVGKTRPSTYMLRKNGMSILNQADLPDFFVTGYWPGATHQLIEEADKKGVKFFIFNTPMSELHAAIVGKPREKYRHYIGHMYPDDLQAGYDLAEKLIQDARRNESNKVLLSGLAGNTDSAVSANRVTGLKRFIDQSASGALLGVYATDWSPAATEIATKKLLTEHPSTNVIWAASDLIALSAAETLRLHGKVPGENILLAGIDWSDSGIQAVTDGVLAASLGGHFMEGGWALLLVHDYYHGIDFKDDLGVAIMTKMQMIDRGNVEAYLAKLGNREWSKIDFKNFSKVYNNKLQKYDLTLENLLNQPQ
jgi:ABC-type sugar transport system substrate-binding protein